MKTQKLPNVNLNLPPSNLKSNHCQTITEQKWQKIETNVNIQNKKNKQ